MDEKTEELRDIFMDVADDETVTERQEDTRGSLTNEGGVDERIETVIETMREQYEFRTELDDEQLCELVRGFYRDQSDADLAGELGVPRSTVFRARMDLHLLRESDTDAAFDLSDLKGRLDDGEPLVDCADAFDVSESTIRRYRDVIEARDAARRASHRFRDEFDAILGDADLADQLTGEMTKDGLKDATEGMETDVSF